MIGTGGIHVIQDGMHDISLINKWFGNVCACTFDWRGAKIDKSGSDI